MVKYLVVACFVAIAATSINANLRSGSTNTAMNVMSSNSKVLQNDVQNVNSGLGYAAAAPVFAPHAGYAYPPLAGYPVPFGFGLEAPIFPAYPAHPGLGYVPGVVGPGYDNINSASTNVASNIMSSDSDVYQHNVQNVDSRY